MCMVTFMEENIDHYGNWYPPYSTISTMHTYRSKVEQKPFQMGIEVFPLPLSSWNCEGQTHILILLIPRGGWKTCLYLIPPPFHASILATITPL